MKKNEICKNYYSQVISNFKKNNIFYKYEKNIVTYKQASNYIKKFLLFFTNSKKKNLNIVVYLDKSVELYCAIESIFLSGSTFIPISKNTPFERIKSMLSSIDVDYFLCDKIKDKKTLADIKKRYKFIDIREILKKKLPANYELSNYISDYDKDAMIYFTSGSTGVPKGTKISHYNYILDFYLQKNNLYKNIKQKLIFGDYHETSFSIFFDIFFPAVFFGSALSPAKTFIEKTEIISHLKKNKVNVLITVPSTIQRISELYKKLKVKINLNVIIITGETFYLNQLAYIYENFKSLKIFNCYGSTELSNWVFFHRCTKSDLLKFKNFNLVPIGKLFKGLKSKIKKNILHIGGDVVSKGYLLKSQNNNKFYNFKKSNWYNTEDRVEKFKGLLICKGRNKNIIKIFGYRVDLSDVETNMRKIKHVNEAYCIKHSKNHRDLLVAFIKDFKGFEEKKIQEKLKKFLPNYMIPKKIIAVKKFPLNNNGKTDRSKLKFQ